MPQGTIAVTVSKTGEVQATLSGTPQLQAIGRLQLATFINDAGPHALVGNMCIETASSGRPTIANPGEPGFGTITQGFLEASNVNPVSEITALITPSAPTK